MEIDGIQSPEVELIKKRGRKKKEKKGAAQLIDEQMQILRVQRDTDTAMQGE